MKEQVKKKRDPSVPKTRKKKKVKKDKAADNVTFAEYLKNILVQGKEPVMKHKADSVFDQRMEMARKLVNNSNTMIAKK